MKKNKNILIQPNLDWYKEISFRDKLPPRCPYVTINISQRRLYF